MVQPEIPTFHPRIKRAWVVALAGAFAVFCGLGLGRFALGMMLPSMSTSLGLDYSQGGLFGFANMAGYLIAVPLVPQILPKLGSRMTITGSLALLAISMTGMAFTSNFLALCVFYFITGIGSGGVVMPSMSSMSQWFNPSHRGLASGIVMAGPGFGIIASGFILPRLAPIFGLQAWQVGWFLFAMISGVVAVLILALFRNHPRDVGQSPVGHIRVQPRPRAGARPSTSKPKLLAQMGLIFGIYGATYMIYVTFIVTSMVDSYKMSENAAGNLWAWFGLLSIFSGVLFGWISDLIGRRAGMAVAFAVLGLAYFLVGFGSGTSVLYVSITLFGIAAWSIPVIMAASSGDFFGPASAANALAVLMLLFSAGQAVGPVMAGFLAETMGDFQMSYALSGGLAILALILLNTLRPPHASA